MPECPKCGTDVKVPKQVWIAYALVIFFVMYLMIFYYPNMERTCEELTGYCKCYGIYPNGTPIPIPPEDLYGFDGDVINFSQPISPQIPASP